MPLVKSGSTWARQRRHKCSDETTTHKERLSFTGGPLVSYPHALRGTGTHPHSVFPLDWKNNCTERNEAHMASVEGNTGEGWSGNRHGIKIRYPFIGAVEMRNLTLFK